MKTTKELIEEICNTTLLYLKQEDYCHMDFEEFIEEYLKEKLKDLVKQGAKSMKEEIKEEINELLLNSLEVSQYVIGFDDKDWAKFKQKLEEK